MSLANRLEPAALARGGAQWLRPLGDPLVAGYVAAAGAWCISMLFGYVSSPNDAHLFYTYGRLPDPYATSDYAAGIGFYYSPPIVLILQPLLALPWLLFAALWTAAEFAALGYLTGRYAVLWLFFPPVWWELNAGNITLFLGAAIVIGSAAWSSVLLTKVTPGIGLLWHLVRREWRPLAHALGATAILCGVSFVLVPSLWVGWIESIASNAGYVPEYFAVAWPLPVRLLAAALIVIGGALTGRRWTIAVGAMLAIPILWFNGLALLAALPRLRRQQASPSPSFALVALRQTTTTRPATSTTGVPVG